MSANLKNIKLGHFGGGGGGGSSAAFALSASLAASSGGGATPGPGGISGKPPLNGATGPAPAPSSISAGGGVASLGTDLEVLTTPGGIVIPIIRTRDVARLLPTIASALQRPADGHLAAEDLDAVQLELEQMLSNVALRARVLKAEYDSLDKDEKRQDRRKVDRLPGSPPCNSATFNGLLGLGGGTSASLGLGSPAGSAAPGAATVKRKREEPTGVRKKHSSMTILKQQQQQHHQQAGSSASKHQAKNSPLPHTEDSLDFPLASNASAGNINVTLPPTVTNPSATLPLQLPPQLPQVAKLSVPKNDTPNKFWLSVEPYCMPLTADDLRLIDDMLDQYKGPLVPPVPPLGPHYSTVWAEEDMKAMQPGGGRMKSQNGSAMLKKADTMVEEGITGPFTQRLVSALMEESLMTLPSEQAAVGEHSNSTTSSSNENTHSSSSNAAPAHTAGGNFRSLTMLKHGVGIEQRLRKELLDNGLLDASELAAHEEDEVLMEIKRVTAEISAVAQFNSEELKRLRAAASEEIKRNDVKRKLDTVDQEILECYKRMLQYRAKRKGHTIEERQEILRLTNEQRLLVEQLERMHLHQMPASGAAAAAAAGGSSAYEPKI
ncbi:hypothetical protein KR018_003002 [Drosophila ironensis]|nr:hypothetical protein KR018_003002 [Drosophila ironensis]